jgi:hypothetical protein
MYYRSYSSLMMILAGTNGNAVVVEEKTLPDAEEMVCCRGVTVTVAAVVVMVETETSQKAAEMTEEVKMAVETTEQVVGTNYQPLVVVETNYLPPVAAALNRVEIVLENWHLSYQPLLKRIFINNKLL